MFQDLLEFLKALDLFLTVFYTFAFQQMQVVIWWMARCFVLFEIFMCAKELFHLYYPPVK